MPQRLPRYTDNRADDAQKLATILLETGEPTAVSSAGATAPGDGSRLRGIPAFAKGTSRAIAGTDPLRALLAKEGQWRR